MINIGKKRGGREIAQFAYHATPLIYIQCVSVIIQNINRGTRGTRMEHKSVHQTWPYLSPFQVTGNGMKK